MVLHPVACLRGLPTRVQKTKIYNLKTKTREYDRYVTYTRHLKNPFNWGLLLAGYLNRRLLLAGIFQKIIWRENFKKPLGGNNFKK
jgi:hypothetical protein